MQRMFSLCLLGLLYQCLAAQPNELKPVRIGDSVPKVLFENFLDTAASPVQLGRLKGKLVILDFWNVGCLACLKSMPKMDSLQKRFGNRIQIILITNNEKEAVEQLFRRIKIQKPMLPFVVADTNYYYKLFPHVGDPLHVWINEEGVVMAITEGFNATVSHVQSLLSGERAKFSARPAPGEFVGDKGLLEQSGGLLNNFVHSYSIVLRGLQKRTTRNSFLLVQDPARGRPRKVTAINVPLLTLYSYAFCHELFGFDLNIHNLTLNNRIVVETRNPLDVRRPEADSVMDEWNERNLWSYEAMTTSESVPALSSVIQTDLQRYSSFDATLEWKERQCLVLRRTSKKDRLASKHKGDAPQVYFNNGLFIQNETLQKSLLPELVIALQHLPCPIVDKTRYNRPVDMTLGFVAGDLNSINKALAKYDLILKKERRKVKMLIIRDKKV